MELINRRKRRYASPSKLKAEAPEFDIRASYGPSPWEQQHYALVKNVVVDKLHPVEGISGYTWCRFPRQRVMRVFNGNIRSIKRPKL